VLVVALGILLFSSVGLRGRMVVLSGVLEADPVFRELTRVNVNPSIMLSSAQLLELLLCFFAWYSFNESFRDLSFLWAVVFGFDVVDVIGMVSAPDVNVVAAVADVVGADVVGVDVVGVDVIVVDVVVGIDVVGVDKDLIIVFFLIVCETVSVCGDNTFKVF